MAGGGPQEGADGLLWAHCRHRHGAVIGGFSFFGAIGILLVASIGGYLFDNVGPTAPFTMVGFANVALLILALLLLFFEGRKNNLN